MLLRISLLTILLTYSLTTYSQQKKNPVAMEKTDKIVKTDAEWQKQLTPEEYRITRKKGTEPAFTGDLWDEHEKGIYTCVCCGQRLFDSTTKFDSGTGWPSFYDADKGAVEEERDSSYGMIRREVHCSRCNAHLGHVFEDGPAPTHLRYCINSASMNFKKD